MQFSFYKYQGTGNDFVIFDGLSQNQPELNQMSISHLCDRKYGIGADGLMIILKSDNSSFKMLYYNADGNQSTMCGNGGRCVAMLAYKLGICDKTCSFEAIDGSHHAYIEDDIVRLEMQNVLRIIPEEAGCFVLDTGSPHFVKFTTHKEELDEIVSFGKKVRYSDRFAKDGINVNMAYWGGKYLEVATYERGVENETLSCGTGVTAAALAAHMELGMNSPVTIQTKGGKLLVHFKVMDGTYTDIILEGPAIEVYKGTITLP